MTRTRKNKTGKSGRFFFWQPMDLHKFDYTVAKPSFCDGVIDPHHRPYGAAQDCHFIWIKRMLDIVAPPHASAIRVDEQSLTKMGSTKPARVQEAPK
jgi:hypothetical protein